MMKIKSKVREKLNWKNLKEWQRQVIQQIAHVAMTFTSVWLLDQILILSVAVLGTILWVAKREIDQWPSSRWWDPYLDWIFQAIGILLYIHKVGVL